MAGGNKSVRLLLLGDNRDAKAKIDEIEAKGAALAAEHPELKIGIDQAVAMEQMRIFRREVKESESEVDRLKRKLKEVQFDKLGAGIGWATGLAAAAGPLPVLFGLAAAGVVGLGSALVPVVAGLGLFGAVVKTGIADVEKADKAHKTLSGGLGELQRSVNRAEGAWQRFTGSALKNGGASTIAKAFNLIPLALSKISPILRPVEKDLNSVFTHIGTSLKSGGLGKFLTSLTGEAGPALSKVTDILGHLASIAGKVVESFTPLGNTVLKDIDSLISKADSGTNGGIQKFLGWLSANGPQVLGIVRNLGSAAVNIGKAFVGLGSVNIGTFSAIASLIATIAKNPIGATALAGLLVLIKVGQVAGPMLKLALALKEVATAERLAALGALAFDAVPIVAVIAGIVLAIVLLITHWRQVEHVASVVWAHIVQYAKDAFNWVKGHWPLLLGILAGPIGVAAALVITHWRQIESGARRMYNNVVGFFRSLPGRIRGVLGDLGHLLWNAGVSILSGLLGGLLQKWQDITSFVGGIASWIGAHKGPISYDAVLLRPHGRAIMGGLVGGLQDGMPSLTRQLTRTTSVIASTKVPAAAGTGNGALQIEWVGGSGADQEFISWLKKNIRIRGGNPTVLGR